MTEKLTILHLNDWHSHFETYPKIKRYFQEYPETDEVIRLDIGDNIDRWHPMTDISKGKCNVQLLNDLKIDFATIGNNEGIGLAKNWLNQVYQEADFDVILGNLEDDNGRPDWAVPYKIYETKAGTKIAFLAYTFPYYLTYKPGGWTVLDPLECLKRDLAIKEVQEADFRILLSHLGLPWDEKITTKCPEIDLIIGAHTHHVFEDGACLNGTYMAAAGKYGQFVGEINLSFDNHELTDITIHAHETSHMASKPGDKEWVENIVSDGR
ncbi:bifunctional UDP-sugar hydrolase/5'-nucleotidase, partial [uncultured Streptococcus sp.]